MKPEDLPDLRALRYIKDNQNIEYDPRARTLHADRPFVIFALLLDRTLGDFICRNLFAASVKMRFRDARLIAYYRPDRPYKSDVLRLNPHVSRSWRSKGSGTMPIDFFDYMGGRPISAPSKGWYKSLSAEPDLVLTPSMMDLEALRGFNPIARFSVPEDLAGSLHDQLVSAGVSEDRWYCVLHYRESGYRDGDTQANRDMPPGDPERMVEHIVETLGGQVVRIGHPDMAELPARPGYVDLGRAIDPLMLHAYAVSRARFFLELSPSGPMALAGAFGVPVARCNSLLGHGVMGPRSFALMQHVVGANGLRVPREIAIAKGLCSEMAVTQVIGRYGYGLVRNSVDELRAAANDIFARTEDCPGWRSSEPPEVEAFPEEFSLPLPTPPEIDIVEYPDAMPVFR